MAAVVVAPPVVAEELATLEELDARFASDSDEEEGNVDAVSKSDPPPSKDPVGTGHGAAGTDGQQPLGAEEGDEPDEADDWSDEEEDYLAYELELADLEEGNGILCWRDAMAMRFHGTSAAHRHMLKRRRTGRRSSSWQGT